MILSKLQEPTFKISVSFKIYVTKVPFCPSRGCLGFFVNDALFLSIFNYFVLFVRQKFISFTVWCLIK